MQCCNCQHEITEPGKVPVAYQREETVVVIRDVPARICPECNEYCLDETVKARLKIIFEASLIPGARLVSARYKPD